MVPAPEPMSLETPASIPMAFLTTFYALVNLGQLHANEGVLIRSAADGVRQAATAGAQHVGAEAFPRSDAKGSGISWRRRTQSTATVSSPAEIRHSAPT